MAKIKRTSINRKRISWLLEQELSIQLEALQHNLDITRMLVNDILEDEVLSYSGIRYSHDKPNNGRYSRWGFNSGNVKFGDQRIPVEVTRLYDNITRCNKPLNTYEKLREIQSIDDGVLKAVLLGLSTRDYDQVIRNLLDSLVLSHSSVINEFI